ncbi:PqqD family protein [Aurantiacibacter sediminis]|uniref:PqqD family protein n=2 Tax=Aurantiacibacter sediminis TaxID=2793064 RepID=A0ABS0MZU9_9SPHN|nr:PqqD family protein [Aurantiacibacter sediminis]
MAIEAGDSFTSSPDVIAREVGGETVLLDLENGVYFGLNPVGGRIWNFLDGETRSVVEITQLLSEEYEIDAVQAEADVIALATDLLEHGLIKPAAD